MSVINRDGIIVTQRHKIPVQEIVHYMCENRDMGRVTARYPLSEQEVWDAVDVYVDTIHSVTIADIDVQPFDRQQVADPGYQLDVDMITEEMYASLMHHGRTIATPEMDTNDLDFMYQLGMHHVIVDVLEFLMDPDANLRNIENSEMHFCVLAALENAYQGDLHGDAGFVIRHMNQAGSPHKETE